MAKISEIIKEIQKKTSCYKVREGSRHEVWINPDTGKEFTIPRHHSKEVPPGTAKSILKDAGLL